MKGVLITFEGGEGAGKSTLIASLADSLQKSGLDFIKTRAPGGTTLGDKIRTLLLHEKEVVDPRAELLLFLADRAQHVKEVIKPALAEGKIILCDRFHDSTIAYQGVARDLNPDIVREFCDFASEGIWPDKTFYLDIDPKAGLARATGAKDRMESEELAFHEKIRGAFHALAEKESNRVYKVDAKQQKQEILEEVLREVYALL